MYLLRDKQSAIREVQKYLYVINDRVNSNVPRVSIDGIYGAETVGAVTVFQEIYGLEVTGLVNLSTFLAIYELYREARHKDKISSEILTDVGFPIALGVQNNDVLIIHALIDQLSNTYVDIGRVDVKSNYFSVASERAVKDLQRIFRMEENGIVNDRFYERMKIEMLSIHRLNEKYQ